MLRLLRGRGKAKKDRAATPADLPAASAAGTPDASCRIGAATISKSSMEAKLAERDALQHKLEAQALSSLKLAPVITKKAEVLAKHLREKITKEPDVASQILRAWIREEDRMMPAPSMILNTTKIRSEDHCRACARPPCC